MLSTWLHRVAYNLCVDRLRAERTVPLSLAPDKADSRAGAALELEQHERAAAVTCALAELPERQAAALTLVYHEGLSNRDAAEVLGVNVDALESLLTRGRQSLRKRLSEPWLQGGNREPRAKRALL